MTTFLPRLLLALAMPALIAGCAASSDKYPSLAIRDAERISGSFTPSAPAEPPVAPVATPQELADILAMASGLNENFLAARPEVERLARAAPGSGSDSAVRDRALVGMAQLTSLRGQTAIALSRLDLLKVEALSTFAPTAEIETAQSTVARMLGEQDATLDSLAARLR